LVGKKWCLIVIGSSLLAYESFFFLFLNNFSIFAHQIT
jgi:hypothetical protein